MASYIGRRKFLATFLGGAAAWPLAARAQQAGKLPTIGFLVPNTRAAASEWTDAFVQRLRELGWIEGRTVAIEYRWVEGHAERFAEIAAEFAKLNVNVIVTSGTPAVQALQEATKTIPIVFATAGDPVSTGLVASLARPGGHTTGLATIGDDLAGKRLELLREVVPHLRRLTLMGNVGNDFTVLEMGQLQNAAALLGLEVSTLEIRQAQDALCDKILRGAKPADIPVEQPTKFDLVINLTAKALHLKIPESFLRADEVIDDHGVDKHLADRATQIASRPCYNGVCSRSRIPRSPASASLPAVSIHGAVDNGCKRSQRSSIRRRAGLHHPRDQGRSSIRVPTLSGPTLRAR